MAAPIKYPGWRYHATKKALVVDTPADDAALGPGWMDHPVALNDHGSPDQISRTETAPPTAPAFGTGGSAHVGSGAVGGHAVSLPEAAAVPAAMVALEAEHPRLHVESPKPRK